MGSGMNEPVPASGPAQEQYRKRSSRHSHPNPHPTFGNNSPSESPWWWKVSFEHSQGVRLTQLQGCTALVSHAGHNGLKCAAHS